MPTYSGKSDGREVYCWRFWYKTFDRVQYYYIADANYNSALLRFFKWVKLIRQICPSIEYQGRDDPSDYLGMVADAPGSQSNTRKAFTWLR